MSGSPKELSETITFTKTGTPNVMAEGKIVSAANESKIPITQARSMNASSSMPDNITGEKNEF